MNWNLLAMSRVSRYVTRHKLMTSSCHGQNTIGNISGTKHQIDLKPRRRVKSAKVFCCMSVTKSGDDSRPSPLSKTSSTSKFNRQYVSNQTSDRLETWQRWLWCQGLSRNQSWWRQQGTPTFYDVINFKIQSAISQDPKIRSTWLLLGMFKVSWCVTWSKLMTSWGHAHCMWRRKLQNAIGISQEPNVRSTLYVVAMFRVLTPITPPMHMTSQ